MRARPGSTDVGVALDPAGCWWATFTVLLAQANELGLTQAGRGMKTHRTGPGMAKDRECSLSARQDGSFAEASLRREN